MVPSLRIRRSGDKAMTCGIYLLEFDDSNYYVGCSVNIEDRFKNHISLLNKNKHYNYKIQNIFNKGIQPTLSILENCLADSIYDREIWWIKELNATKSLNISSGGNHPISLSGYLSHNAKLTKENVLNIIYDIINKNCSYKVIANDYDISEEAVKDIVYGKTHKWIQIDYPELWVKVINKKLYHIKNNCKVISPEGEIYNVVYLRNFCIEHKLNVRMLNMLINGDIRQYKGWVKYEIKP